MNQDSGSPPDLDTPMRRKRGRPRKDESLHQQENSPITRRPDSMSSNDAADDMVGQVVSGVVEGSFDAGYFLSVNVKDTDKELKGVVFITDKVTPITAVNDVAPYAKMYEREEIAIPSLDQQTQSQGQIDDIQKETESGGVINATKQSLSCMASFPHDQPLKTTGCGPNLQSFCTATDMYRSGSDETRLRDLQIKDIDGISSGENVPPVQMPEYVPSANQALPLMPQAGNGDFSKQHGEVNVHDTSGASNKPNTETVAPNDSVTGTTRFVDFFPHHETTQQKATGSGSNPNLVLFQDEAKPSGTEQQKSPAYAETHGFNLLTEKPDIPMENVPEELQLELGNKTMSGANTRSNNNPEPNLQPAASKSGFLANLFEREVVASDSGETVVPESDNSTNKKVDCNMDEAIPPEQRE